MKTINLNFSKPFLKMAKNYQMTPVQVLQHLVSGVSFCHFYLGITTGIPRRIEIEDNANSLITEVSAVDVASIEEAFKTFKRHKADNLSGIALRYLNLVKQLGQQMQTNDELLTSANQLMKDWEGELKPLYNIPARINVYHHGVINLTLDFTLICLLTGFTIEEALQVYIDRCVGVN